MSEGPVILGLDPAKCDTIYPRTRDGRCQGCGVFGAHPGEPTMDCRTCGRLVEAAGGDTCNACWEVESRLTQYLDRGGAKARQAVLDVLADDLSAGAEPPLLYAIEPTHVAMLRSVATRLYTEMRMDGNEMRDSAHAVMAVVRYAEALDALRKPGEPYLHLYPREKK